MIEDEVTPRASPTTGRRYGIAPASFTTAGIRESRAHVGGIERTGSRTQIGSHSWTHREEHRDVGDDVVVASTVHSDQTASSNAKHCEPLRSPSFGSRNVRSGTICRSHRKRTTPFASGRLVGRETCSLSRGRGGRSGRRCGRSSGRAPSSPGNQRSDQLIELALQQGKTIIPGFGDGAEALVEAVAQQRELINERDVTFVISASALGGAQRRHGLPHRTCSFSLDCNCTCSRIAGNVIFRQLFPTRAAPLWQAARLRRRARARGRGASARRRTWCLRAPVAEPRRRFSSSTLAVRQAARERLREKGK